LTHFRDATAKFRNSEISFQMQAMRACNCEGKQGGEGRRGEGVCTKHSMDYVVQTIYVNESVEWSDGCVGREVGVNGGSTSSVLNVCKSVYFICSMQRDSLPLPLATFRLVFSLLGFTSPRECWCFAWQLQQFKRELFMQFGCYRCCCCCQLFVACVLVLVTKTVVIIEEQGKGQGQGTHIPHNPVKYSTVLF